MKRLVTMLLLCAALLATISALDESPYTHDYFSGALATAGVRTTVTIDGLRYEVSGGVVTANGAEVSDRHTLAAQKLAYEKTMAERAPLFGLPGVDPARLRQAVRALHEKQRQLAKSQKNTVDAYLMRTALYPIHFLESAALLEQARKDFISSGDANDAMRYETLLIETSQAYRSDLRQFRMAFLTSVPSDTPPYGTVNKIIDRTATIRILSSFGDRIAEVEHVRRNRAICILGKTSACDPRDIATPHIPPVAQNTIKNKGAPVETESLYREAGFPIKDGPGVELSESSCVDERAYRVFFFMPHGAPILGTYIAPVYTGDLILVKSKPYAESFFYHYFYENEVEYVLTDPLAYYECPAASSDFASAISTLHVARFAKTHDFSPLLQSDVARSVAALKTSLSSAELVSERDAVAYLNTLLFHLPHTAENEEAVRELTELSLGFSYQTAGLVEYIGTMVEFEDQNQSISKRGVDFDTSARNMFYLKSGFSSLLRIPHTQSDAEFRPNTLPKSSQPYTYYSDLYQSPEIRERIRADLAFFRNLHLGK